MKRYRPLLLKKLDIRVPGLRIRRLALHRHLPETSDIGPHSHKFFQCLVYLSGQGRQQIEQAHYPTRTGTAVFLPPGVAHAFHRMSNRPPVCLILDFDWRGAKQRSAYAATLPQSALHEVREQLVGVTQLQSQSGPPPLLASALILKLLNAILRGLNLAGQSPAVSTSALSRKVEALLAAPESANVSLGELARAAGYQHDYLNRLLKNSIGLTIGQLRSRQRFLKAKRFLGQSGSVTEVATALGFADPNYFARWFRKLSGKSPGEWRRIINHDPDDNQPHVTGYS